MTKRLLTKKKAIAGQAYVTFDLLREVIDRGITYRKTNCRYSSGSCQITGTSASKIKEDTSITYLKAFVIVPLV